MTDWDAIAVGEDFRRLRREQVRFIVPAMTFFVVYYFALPILVGYAPAVMRSRVFGAVNVAYLFALSQFFMAWTIAFLYVRAARRWDEAARAIREAAARG